MKTPSPITRITAVAAAGILTFLLFSSIVSISEPQRSALIQLRWRTWTITEPQGVLWLEACGFEDIKSQPVNFGSHAGAATIALWGRRPASKRQDPQTENADRKTGLVA